MKIIVEGKNTKLTINTAGRIIIYAYAVDTEGNETEISSLEIKYDNVKPNVGEIAVTPEVPASGWYTSNIEITLPNMSDNVSGIAGYYYWEVTGDVADIPQEEKTYVSGETGKVIVESEGEKTIAFQAKDNAGNISSMSSITIRKDSTPPDDFTPSITNETATGFTINGTSSDSTSGLAGYYFYVDGILQNSEISISGTYNVTGMSANKTYSVYMEAVDKAGNKKKSTSITAKTNGELLKPRISLSGEQGENGYYKGNVTVTIEDSASEDITGTNQIRYQVTGSNQIGETTVNGRTATFEITIDGTSTITAQAVSKDGNVSETETKTVNKDSTPPTASLTAGTVGETSIEVTANGNDSTSGIASYEFQRSTTNQEGDFVTAKEEISTSNSIEYTYEGLASNTTYYLRVIVTDNAGNTKKSEAIEVTTKGPLSEIELASNVGKYVDYTPISGTFDDHVGPTYSGDTSGINTELTTDESLKWRILSAENNILTLISDKETHDSFTLQGADGYNNAVLLLNNACELMYSNNALGATGRSLDLDDIIKYANIDSNDSYYGQELTPDRPRHSYPNIFAEEKTGIVDGVNGTKYGLSEQDRYITGTSNATSLRGIDTDPFYFDIDIDADNSNFKSEIYIDLFAPDKTVWLASRSTTGTNTTISFMVDIISFVYSDWSYVIRETLYYSHIQEDSFSHAVHPVVEIDLTKVNVGQTGSGVVGDTYSIVTRSSN